MTETAHDNNPASEEQKIRKILEQVADPEIPVLSVADLGIVRQVQVEDEAGEKKVVITITPTYSGCPALDVMRTDIRLKLLEHGYQNVQIQRTLSPAWTTEWMSEEGKRKLKAYGVAPPNPKQQFCSIKDFFQEEAVSCPHCNSRNTQLISRFGSTACKAVYQCRSCQETFDYFKCH